MKYLSQIRVVNNAQEFSAKGGSQRAPGYAITLRRGVYRSGQSFVAALAERGLGLKFGQRPPALMAATVSVATRSGSGGNNAYIWHSYQIFASLNIDLKQCYTPLKASFYVKITRSIGRRPILFNHMYSIRLEGNSRVRVKYTG